MASIEEYLADLASERPTPGGGSAAMFVGAAGCALVAMVARICSRSPKYAGRTQTAHAISERADALRAEMLRARLRDESAYARVVAAQELPRGSDAERTARTAALQPALRDAAAEPLEGARLALGALQLAAEAAALKNDHLASDLGCAAQFAYAALNACAYNVRVNHRYMHDKQISASQIERLERCERDAAALLPVIQNIVAGAIK